MSTLIEILADVQNYMQQYGWSLLFAFGSIGCILNICLFSRRRFRTVSCCLCQCRNFQLKPN